MRKLFLTFVTALLCSIVSFAQSGIIEISSAEDFLKIGTNSSYPANGSYQQTADIDLGTFTQDTAIITTFSGTYDGNGYSITYQASFSATGDNARLGLFGTVNTPGTIKNLKLTNCSMTASSEGENTANIALLCAHLNGANALITDCKVVNGEIRSTIMVGEAFARVATGMLVGHLENGRVEYSSADGVVVGMGYVGGLVGQSSAGKVTGSSFSGDVTATYNSGGWLDFAGDALGTGRGGYAGGIVGFANEGSTIQFCYANADISAPDMPTGVGGTNIAGWLPSWWTQSTGKPDVMNNYCEGTINGKTLLAKNITNSAGNTATNYFPDGSYTNGGSVIEMIPDSIAAALNRAVDNSDYDEDKIQFSSPDDNVIFGVVIGGNENRICGVPTNLVVRDSAGNYIATWNRATTGENIIVEDTWKYMLSGGDLSQVYHGTTTDSTISSPLPASRNPYTFTVYTDCSDTVNGLTSEAVSQTFTVPCPIPTGLTASKITDNGFIISWNANVDCQLTVNGNTDTISAGNTMKDTITGLEPETQYTAIVKAKCGNEYVEQASINVTTARLAAPTGLTVTPTWQSESGKIVVEWDTVPGLTYEYEINGESGDTVSGPAVFGFQKTGLGEGAYTLKLRAKKGTKTSEWVSMPYTISNPEAPKNPEVNYDQQEGSFKVTIEWEQGVEGEVTWFVAENTADLDGDPISMPYVLTNQQAGETFSILIKEKSNNGQNVSQALVVPIQVPCLDASEPTSIEPALNSVTFNFADAKTRKIFIGSTIYDVNATTVTIDSLTEGTSYAYEIREYCNVETNTYSSISSTFSTLACYAVAGLSVSNVELTTATVSWTSQSSIDGLEYKVVVNEGEPIIQTAKTINLTGLTQSTEYTVEVYEQCGAVENWGAVSSITFTTKGTKNYISATDGDFTTGSTWIGGRAPNSADTIGTTITISQGHTLTLSSAFIIDSIYTVTNNGILVIQQGGELINTTSNNVGGIIEVVTPIKDQNNWHFVGAPFAGYKLEAIKPVEGSDVAITTFNYDTGKWHSSDSDTNTQWATYETWINEGEGYYAWQFYDGAMRFTTYGDLWVWDTDTTGHNGSYTFNKPPLYELNNKDSITFTDTIKQYTANGYWMALSNPYPFKLDVDKFLRDNSSAEIQGEIFYRYNGENFVSVTSGEINVTEGFFVNFTSNGKKTAKFKKTQRNAPSAKANAEREFIRLALVQGKREVELLFAQNEDAEQGYDILDANKLFSPMGVAEPYFVTDGIALVKEEVRDLPYYATMNVRSQEDTVMNFVLTNLPEGYAVSIIDGEEVIDLVEGGVYSTEIASGENADRFKVLVKKNVGLADVEELDVRITNSNRHITITAQENVRTEVYNTLGQKVFETEETNFVLSGVASGAYVVKVQGAKASKSQKIVVE